MNEKDKKIEVVGNNILTSNIVGLEVNQSVDANKVLSDGLLNSGIDIKKVCDVLNDGLSAQKMSLDKYGDQHFEKDHNTRHKFLLTSLELMGILKQIKADSGTVTQTNVFVNNIDVDERINALRNFIDEKR